MDVPRIVSVTPLPERRLLVRFTNGVEKVYDCRQVMDLERFQLLRTEAFLRGVRVDPGGYSLSWSDEIDLSEYELWTNGLEMGSEETSGEANRDRVGVVGRQKGEQRCAAITLPAPAVARGG